MTYSINIIGAGKVGQTIARCALLTNDANIIAVCNQTLSSSLKAIKAIGGGQAYQDINTLPHSDICLLTLPDDELPDMVKRLGDCHHIKRGTTFIHCSGLISSDIMSALKKNGHYIASCHPMYSFTQTSLSLTDFKQIYCAIEGCNQGKIFASRFFQSLGATTFYIDKVKKPLYHAAASMASNFLVTLADVATNMLSEINITDAKKIIGNLMHNTLDNIDREKTPKDALTGPIMRGDTHTIQSHLEIIDDELIMLYKQLALKTLVISRAPLDKKESILNVLQQTRHES